jgi:predicted enzyme related to lactoylglutathione lyase
VKLSFEVEDVVSEIERLEALGVTIIKRPWGAYDGVDPEGNVFGICSA